MKKLTTDEWVRRVNALARELDASAAALHPSAWHEALAPDLERFRRLCGRATRDEAEQLGLDLG